MRSGPAKAVQSANIQGPLPAGGKVIASKKQLVVLNALFQRTGGNANKEEIVQAVKDTGLKEKWIRDWMHRQRRPRSRKSVSSAVSSCGDKSTSARSPTSLTSADRAPTGFSGSYGNDCGQAFSTNPLSTVNRKFLLRPAFPSVVPPAPDTSNDSPPTQVAIPGSSFSIPFRTKTSPVPSPLLLPDNHLDMRSLTRSPSLGYIPLAFPLMDTASETLSQTNSAGEILQHNLAYSATTSRVYQPVNSHRSLPQVPVLEMPCYQPDPSQNSSNMAYLSRLLLEATNPLPLYRTLPSDTSYVSALSQPVLGSLSFAPSLQSHSTSALGNTTTASDTHLPFPPPPLAYTTGITDLAALTKRVRTTFEDASLSMNDSVDLQKDDMSCDGSLSWTTGRSFGCRGLFTSFKSRVADSQIEERLPRQVTASVDSLGHSSSPAEPISDVCQIAGEPDESDAEDEELLTPAEDIPAFIRDGTRFNAQGKGKAALGKTDFIAQIDGAVRIADATAGEL